jgi:hypothetical protein
MVAATISSSSQILLASSTSRSASNSSSSEAEFARRPMINPPPLLPHVRLINLQRRRSSQGKTGVYCTKQLASECWSLIDELIGKALLRFFLPKQSRWTHPSSPPPHKAFNLFLGRELLCNEYSKLNQLCCFFTNH